MHLSYHIITCRIRILASHASIYYETCRIFTLLLHHPVFSNKEHAWARKGQFRSTADCKMIFTNRPLITRWNIQLPDSTAAGNLVVTAVDYCNCDGSSVRSLLVYGFPHDKFRMIVSKILPCSSSSSTTCFAVVISPYQWKHLAIAAMLWAAHASGKNPTCPQDNHVFTLELIDTVTENQKRIWTKRSWPSRSFVFY